MLGELVGELHRHAAAERVPDERRALVPEREQQVADPAGVGAQRVVAAGLGRLAVAEQVGGDDGEALGQVRAARCAHVADVDVIPWTSTSAGPLPADR